MEVPVYLFTGFMDSGKTTLITETLIENDFGEGGKGLIIVCEEGEKEYDEGQLVKQNISLVKVGKQEEFTSAFLEACASEWAPEQVFIEYNGTWDAATILEMDWPAGWEIVQSLATVDASTYELYLNNMRAMMMEQVFHVDVVIFNRCTEDTPKGKFRRSVKARNRKAQIVYERVDGTIDQGDPDELPYDLNQDIIGITDEDFGIFYLDSQENPKKYEKKKVRFLALVYRPEKYGNKPVFIGGRFAMTCCEDDIQFVGFKCKYADASEIEHKSWINLTAEISVEFAKEYRGRGPVLHVLSAEPTDAPQDDLVYFN